MPNYLLQAILTTVFCCLPFGIVSIVFASQVNSKLQGNDYAGALQSSKNAKLWAWIAFGCGAAVFVIWLIMFAIGMASGLHQSRPGGY